MFCLSYSIGNKLIHTLHGQNNAIDIKIGKYTTKGSKCMHTSVKYTHTRKVATQQNLVQITSIN